jgi:hypothetical protein
MYVLCDVIRFEIKNNREAVMKFLSFMSENEELIKAKQTGDGKAGYDNLKIYFRPTPEVRSILNHYIVNEITKTDN